MEAIWMNKATGETRCVKHAGGELGACINSYPEARSHDTFLGHWVRTSSQYTYCEYC